MNRYPLIYIFLLLPQNLEFSTPEDTPYNGNMLGFDQEDQNLIYSIVDQPSNGVITNLDTLSGSFTYVPFDNYNGLDLFSFRVNDGTYMIPIYQRPT